MKCEKINNYKLTGSIHTLQIKSMDTRGHTSA